MSNEASNAVHDEVSLLLPWYINGTLSTPEHEKVHAHLHDCAECRDEAELCSDTMTSVQQQGPTPILPATTAAQILEDAQNDVARKTYGAGQQRWAIAAGLGFVALLVVISLKMDFSSESANQRFDTATSSAAPGTMDYVLELHFADGVSIDDRLAIIDELGGRDTVMGAEQMDVRIVIGLAPQSLDELEQHASDIASRPEIESAKFVALQLPVR